MKFAIIGALVLILVGVPAGLYFGGFLHFGAVESEASAEEDSDDGHGGGGSKEASKGELPEIYLPLDPAFVVNFTHRGTLHYLQLEMQLMYHDQALIDQITDHMPAVRNDLILLFSDQAFEKISTQEGKEILREEIIQTVNHRIKHEPDEKTGESDGEVFITHFVMQ